MTAEIKKRLRKIQRALKDQAGSSALIISSGVLKVYSRDQHYSPFRQNSDFYYLTGSEVRNTVILISTREERPLLFSAKPSAHQVLWEGKPPSVSALARSLGARYISTDDAVQSVLKKLQGIETLYHNTSHGSISNTIAAKLFALPSHRRSNYPGTFVHSDALIEPLRLYKSRQEVAAIREAAKITAIALENSLDLVRPGRREYEVAAAVEYQMKLHRSYPAFNTIAASGRSAATLHYEDLSRTLRKGELFLLDYGATHNLYAADITRMLPVGGKFEGALRDLYSVVLESQEAAIRKVRHNVRISTVYNAAAKKLTAGLKDLKILKGSLAALIERKAFRDYFPHSIGHSLGLDVHDIGKLRGNNSGVLKKGMVFTIEPGLYFPRKTGPLPPCGVRIEDDVLVTETGCKILTPEIPKEIDAVEELLRR